MAIGQTSTVGFLLASISFATLRKSLFWMVLASLEALDLASLSLTRLGLPLDGLPGPGNLGRKEDESKNILIQLCLLFGVDALKGDYI